SITFPRSIIFSSFENHHATRFTLILDGRGLQRPSDAREDPRHLKLLHVAAIDTGESAEAPTLIIPAIPQPRRGVVRPLQQTLGSHRRKRNDLVILRSILLCISEQW